MKNLRNPLLCLTLALALLLAACGSSPASPPAPVHADLSALYEQLCALPDSGETQLVSEKRLRNFYGIDPDTCPQVILAQSSDTLRADEIWLIEAGSETQAEELYALAQSRIEQLGREMKDYLPEQYAVVQKAVLVRSVCYVGLFISPASETMAEQFQQALAG